LVDSFSLTIRFRMICRRHGRFYTYQFHQFLPEVGVDPGVAITNDLVWWAMQLPYVAKETLCQIFGIGVVWTFSFMPSVSCLAARSQYPGTCCTTHLYTSCSHDCTITKP